MFRLEKVCAALLIDTATGHTKSKAPAILLVLKHSHFTPSSYPESAIATLPRHPHLQGPNPTPDGVWNIYPLSTKIVWFKLSRVYFGSQTSVWHCRSILHHEKNARRLALGDTPTNQTPLRDTNHRNPLFFSTTNNNQEQERHV